MTLPKPYYEDKQCTIYHGDCLELMPAMEAESVDVIWTDPPYGHGNGQDDLMARRAEACRDGIATRATPIANDTQDEMRAVVDGMLREAARVLKRECCCCCCSGGGGGAEKPTFAWLANRMNESGLSFFHSVIWDKRNPGMGWRFRRQHEMVMVSHRRGGKLKWANDRAATPNIMSYYPPRDRVHPNEKPLGLVTKFLGHIATVGDVVLDPFMGSGTTIVAAKSEGLRAIGIELEERYCEIAANRLRQRVLF